MAITKLLRIKESPHGNPGSGLKRCLRYICNPEKTDEGRLISGNAGQDPDTVFLHMMNNKQFYDKLYGTQGFHYVISFSPDDPVDNELALRIAQDFCRELLKDEYIYTIASHTDTGHSHVHIVFDSVNLKTGTIFHSSRFDWKNRIQPITDSICERYGLSGLSYDERKESTGMYHKEWEHVHNDGTAEKDVSWNDIIRTDIDECISLSSTWEEFLSLMEKKKYEYHDGKYLSLRPYGKEKAVRSVRLGPGYSKEELLSKAGIKKEASHTEQPDPVIYGNPVPVCRSTVNYYRRKGPYSSWQKHMWRRWNRLCHIRRNKQLPVWKYNKEVVRLGKLSDQLVYLFDHDITSIDDIKTRLDQLSKDRGIETSRERRLCREILDEYRKSKDSVSIMNEPSAFESAMPKPETIKQISVNKVLFDDADLTKETFTVRIPGTSEMVRLYSTDSRIYNNGDMVSSYIYPEACYFIVDSDNKAVRKITGEELAVHFRSREIERKGGR